MEGPGRESDVGAKGRVGVDPLALEADVEVVSVVDCAVVVEVDGVAVGQIPIDFTEEVEADQLGAAPEGSDGSVVAVPVPGHPNLGRQPAAVSTENWPGVGEEYRHTVRRNPEVVGRAPNLGVVAELDRSAGYAQSLGCPGIDLAGFSTGGHHQNEQEKRNHVSSDLVSSRRASAEEGFLSIID